jgi:hypothetical protein
MMIHTQDIKRKYDVTRNIELIKPIGIIFAKLFVSCDLVLEYSPILGGGKSILSTFYHLTGLWSSLYSLIIPSRSIKQPAN